MILYILILGCTAISIIGCFFIDDLVSMIISILSNIVSITISILMLPKIIAKYLFPSDEDKHIKDLITYFKDSDDLRRYNDKQS